MTQEEIQEKMREIEAIISQYKSDLSALEKELIQVMSDYQNALDQEKMKQIVQS